MRISPFFNFSRKLYEAEADEPDLEKVLKKSPKVTYTLMRLLTSQKEVNQKAQEEIRNVVGDIKIISFRPTTFRIVFKNSNYFDLIYDPSPLELKSENDYKPSDFFRVAIVGKRYDLSNQSAFEQSLDYIGQCMKYNPIDSNNPDEQQAATADGEEGAADDGDTATADLPVKSDSKKPA